MTVLKTKTDLVRKAIETGDIYCAAAVYDIANNTERSELKYLMFSKRRNALLLARWEHTPVSVLLELSEDNLNASASASANHSDSAILIRLDKNPNTPAQALSQHYEYEKRTKQTLSLMVLVARHQHTPIGVLENIARFDSDVESLKALSRNASTNENILTTLVNRMPHTFDKNVAAHAAASANLLMLIYGRADVYTRATVIMHENCPLSLIKNAECDNNLPLIVLRPLAKDLRLSPQFLIKLLANKDSVVRCGVASNLATPKVQVRQLLNDISVPVRRAIASRNDLTISSIKFLMNDKDAWVRQWLARNLRVPSKLLKQLSRDPHIDVRRAVARNPRCPVELLDVLAKDKSAWVRSAVAYHKRTPMRLMRLLAEDTDIDVLSGVANNQHTPQNILQKLALSVEADIRRGVILNINATRKTLLPLLEDSYYLHRLMLIARPQLKDQDIWHLCDDPDYQVRFMVFRHFANKLQLNS